MKSWMILLVALLAGGAGGLAVTLGFAPGRHLQVEEGSVPLSNLFVSMLQAVDPTIDRFMDSTGALKGLS